MRAALLGLTLLAAAPLAVSAQGDASPDHSGLFIGPVLEGGYEFGGDKVFTVPYRDGTHSYIKTGEGGIIAGGGHLRLYRDSPFDLRATIGYKEDSADARNGDIRLDRITYELTPSVRFPFGVWGGIGVVHQSSIKFDGDGFTPDVHYKAATGANFELGWRSRTYGFVDGGVALVYTLISYRDESDNHYNADSIGLRFTANFGWTVFGRERPVVVEAPVSVTTPPTL